MGRPLIQRGEVDEVRRVAVADEVRSLAARAFLPGVTGCVAGLLAGPCNKPLASSSARFCPLHLRCPECDHPSAHYLGCPKTE